MRRLEGKVAVITGAGRGQGRSHAVRFAEEGADLILLDGLTDIPTVPYPMSGKDDLAETVRAAEAAGARVVAGRADVRDASTLQAVVEEGIGVLGHLDVVVANAGISPRLALLWEITAEEWDDTLAINLTGVWNTIRATVPALVEQGTGGAIVLTSSGAGLSGIAHLGAYNASKHGVIGLAKTLANELARHDIRVNAVCPGTVETPMVTENHGQRSFFRPDLSEVSLEDMKDVLRNGSPLGRPWIEPVDVSNAILYLVSDEGRYVTGVALPVDQGSANRT